MAKSPKKPAPKPAAPPMDMKKHPKGCQCDKCKGKGKGSCTCGGK